MKNEEPMSPSRISVVPAAIRFQLAMCSTCHSSTSVNLRKNSSRRSVLNFSLSGTGCSGVCKLLNTAHQVVRELFPGWLAAVQPFLQRAS